jgi:hypothetical protein
MVILPGIAPHGRGIHRKNGYSAENYQFLDEESANENYQLKDEESNGGMGSAGNY